MEVLYSSQTCPFNCVHLGFRLNTKHFNLPCTERPHELTWETCVSASANSFWLIPQRLATLS